MSDPAAFREQIRRSPVVAVLVIDDAWTPYPWPAPWCAAESSPWS